MFLNPDHASECVRIILLLGQKQYEYPGALKKAYPAAINLGKDIVKEIQQLTVRIEEYDKTIKDKQDALQELESDGVGDLPRLGDTEGPTKG